MGRATTVRPILLYCPTMEESVFTKIINREIPADIVYEDEDTIAFLDITPTNPGHTLVVPKRPARNVFDIEERDWVALAKTVHKIVHAVKNAVGAEGVNITMNNEPAAGQEVFHAHIHLIPRYASDGFGAWPKKTYGEGEKAAIAEKIRAAM